jgi:DNA-binding response OmpR family regulator
MITKDSKKILVADDSLVFRTKLSEILAEAGHVTLFAKDGMEVINELKKDSDGIDLLILDLQMPQIDGFGVLEWIRDNDRKDRFPVLAITGVYEPNEVMERLKGLGATGLMTKGFTPGQIVFRVNRLLFPEKAAANPRARVPVSIPVDFSFGDLTWTGSLLNLSEGGAFLHTEASFLIGALVHLKFSLPGVNRILNMKAIIKWSTGEMGRKTLLGGYGLMFSSIEEQDRDIVKKYIDVISKQV